MDSNSPQPAPGKTALDNDRQRLEHLICARHPVILITTTEEEAALQLLRESATDRGCDLWLWSITGGLRDGLIMDSPAVVDTDHPAAALLHIVEATNRRCIIAMLDLVGHLRDERTLRMLRDAIEKVSRHHGTIILIDPKSDLPAAIDGLATRLDLSLPDDAAVEQCIRQTLREINASQRLEVTVTRKGLAQMAKNLRGLTCRQVRQLTIDAVADDMRFDDADVGMMLAAKRRALGGGSLLEYIDSPATLDEIGGLTKLKSWLSVRQNCLGDEAAA